MIILSNKFTLQTSVSLCETQSKEENETPTSKLKLIKYSPIDWTEENIDGWNKPNIFVLLIYQLFNDLSIYLFTLFQRWYRVSYLQNEDVFND